MKRVGVLAGTFDPIHAGHLAFARAALLECTLDKIFFLVEPAPRRKQGVKSIEHRIQMVQLAIADEKHFGTIILGQTQFSVEGTLPLLQARFAGSQLSMLLGEDVLGHLSSWPHVKELVQAVHFIIGVRAHSKTRVQSIIHGIEKTRGLSFHYDIITTEAVGVSSSKVRTRLRRGEVPSGLPATVVTYIRANQLYSSVASE